MLRQTCVLTSVGNAGHIVHFGSSGVENDEALFLILGWNRYGFDKKRVRTRYTELAFLHPVGSMGHVVQSIELGP
jgi:hypothetical protein